MREGMCFIAGAGEFFYDSIKPSENDFVIGADGGYEYLKQEGIPMNLVIGDFDSLHEELVHPNVIRLEKEKDDTDMMAAVKTALEKGYRNFRIYGGLGGRVDHTLSNIQMLVYLLSHQAHGCLVGKDCFITAIRNEGIVFEKQKEGLISVICHGDRAEKVVISGLKYELKDACLTNDFPLGVSNEFVGKEGMISVDKGTLIILYTGLNRTLRYKIQ